MGNNIQPPFIGDDLKPNIDVLGRFANAFDANPSMKKTQLHMASRLRWDSFLRYLDWLQKNNHISSDSEGRSEEFHPTKSGSEMFSKIMKFLEYVKSNKTVALFSVLYITVMAAWMMHS